MTGRSASPHSILKPVRAVAAVFALSLVAAWVGCGSSQSSGGNSGNNSGGSSEIKCNEAPKSVCFKDGPVRGKCAPSVEGKCCIYSNTDHAGGETESSVTCVNGMWQ